jgi:rubrerythrin
MVNLLCVAFVQSAELKYFVLVANVKEKQVIKKVKTALHEEKEAIRDYRKDAKTADKKTAKLFRHIANEESHHHKELSKRLKALSK